MTTTAIFVDGGYYRKHASRMWSQIKDNLFEHIDGMHSNWGKK